MNDIQIPPFFWFRPATARGQKKDVCFRAGVEPLEQDKPQLAMDPPGSPVRLPLMETPSWRPPGGGWFHFGRFEAMVFLLRLYVHFMSSLNNPGRTDKYNLGELIKNNMDLSPLQGRKPKILLGDMTGHGGHAVPGHATHSSGQQIDIHYIPDDGTNAECFCDVPDNNKKLKKWHLGLNALLLHCILEVGATSVVTDCKVFHDTVKPGPGQQLNRSRRDSQGNIVSDPNKAAQVHKNHFHVDVFHTDHRSKEFVKVLYANAEKGILEARGCFFHDLEHVPSFCR